MSDDCLNSSPIANQLLYGVNNSKMLAIGNEFPEDMVTCISVLGKKDFRLGGQFGSEFVSGNVCRVMSYATHELMLTVSFDTDGGTSVLPQNVNYGGYATKPTTTKTGYTFENWYKDEEKTQVFNFTTEQITEDITLYAKWTINTYLVEFDTDGGSEVASQTIEYDGLVTEPTAPTKENYTFDGWYTTQDYQIAFDFSTRKITQNTTIYAKWI